MSQLATPTTEGRRATQPRGSSPSARTASTRSATRATPRGRPVAAERHPGTAYVIAVANQKGGVAKTTSVASLGAAFAEAGRRVLLVDLDAQACLTFSLGVDPDRVQRSINEVLLGQAEAREAVIEADEGVHLLPSVIDLAGVEAQLLSRPGREFLLRTVLEPVLGDYDVVLLDCSPSLGVLTLAALTAADGLIIPMPCEMLSHRGVGQLLDTVRDVTTLLNPESRCHRRAADPLRRPLDACPGSAGRRGGPLRSRGAEPADPQDHPVCRGPGSGPVHPHHGPSVQGCGGLPGRWPPRSPHGSTGSRSAPAPSPAVAHWPCSLRQVIRSVDKSPALGHFPMLLAC